MSGEHSFQGVGETSVVRLRPRHSLEALRARVRDSSGYALFSGGDTGAAHVMAHRMLDSGRVRRGRALLRQWLDGRAGSGSDWAHLHFHMCVFDLAVRDWDAAYARFVNEILPVAARTEDALTDAPALLWRLALSASTPVSLPWQPVRRTALARMRRPAVPFVELHNLLALAGANDLGALEWWLETRSARAAATQPGALVRSTAIALHAYTRGAYGEAAALLQALLPRLPSVGGSRAQNELFADIVESCRRLAAGTVQAPTYSKAA